MDFHRLLTRQVLPTLLDDLRIDVALLHGEAPALHLGCRDERRPTSSEGLKNEVVTLGEYLDVRDQNFHGLGAEDDALAGRFLVGGNVLDEIGRADLLAFVVPL